MQRQVVDRSILIKCHSSLHDLSRVTEWNDSHVQDPTGFQGSQLPMKDLWRVNYGIHFVWNGGIKYPSEKLIYHWHN
jgi:hypothetical protein